MTYSHVLCHDYDKAPPLQVSYQALALREADLIFSDPPYNIGARYDDDRTGDKRPLVEYQAFVVGVLSQLRQVARSGALLWWVAPPEQIDWLPGFLTQYFGPRLHTVVWYETFSQYQQKTLTRDFRILFCHRTMEEGHLTFNPDDIRIESVRQEMGDKRADPRGRVPGSVWRIRRLQGTATDAVDWHPNQIPPELLERIVRGWSNPGDVVMDAFAGSGSLGIQCGKLNRTFVGIDKSRTYCQKMRDRIQLACTLSR